VSRPTDRKNELLADRALQGLSELEARELEALGGAGDESFDYAAGAAALAELGELEAMPAGLAEKVRAQARASTTGRDAPLRSARTDDRVRAEGRGVHAPRWDRGRTLGWLAAAAAAVVAVFGWMRPPTIVKDIQVVEVAPRVPTAAEARQALLAQATDVKTIAWSATPDPAAKGADGDVVWSPSKQQGYMRIRGLAANDPRAQQYQLWIFDGTRDQRYPVDGGVFDVKDGEVVVPIKAPIEVREPKLFAITVEKPGGVVVSGRERIVLTAAL